MGADAALHDDLHGTLIPRPTDRPGCIEGSLSLATLGSGDFAPRWRLFLCVQRTAEAKPVVREEAESTTVSALSVFFPSNEVFVFYELRLADVVDAHNH